MDDIHEQILAFDVSQFCCHGFQYLTHDLPGVVRKPVERKQRWEGSFGQVHEDELDDNLYEFGNRLIKLYVRENLHFWT